MSDTEPLFAQSTANGDVRVGTLETVQNKTAAIKAISQQTLGELRLFPDTGFHQHFFPLVTRTASQNAAALARHGIQLLLGDGTGFVLDDKVDSQAVTKIVQWLRQLIGTQPDWRQRPCLVDPPEWLKGWYGVRELKIPIDNAPGEYRKVEVIGIWMAVETNLGTRQRGFTTRESHPPTEAEIESAERLRLLPPPYVFEHLASVRGSRQIEVVVGTADKRFDIGHVSLHWLTPAGQNAINVDLIVDFGNTRSAVLALEHIQNSPSLAPICKPVPFCSREETFDGFADFGYDGTLADSWLLLKQPHFESGGSGQSEIPDWDFRQFEETTGVWPLRKTVTKLSLDRVTYRSPQIFSSLSPVLIGNAARRELLELDLTTGAKLFLSSPKRYAWDTDPANQAGDLDWHMVPSGGYDREAMRLGNRKLECRMLRFMPADGSDWELKNPPNRWPQHKRPVPSPIHPQYPRSDSLAWTALAMLENAFRVINSEPWRRGNQPFSPRKLREIIVTYPSGWTAGEIEAYRAKWQKAINVFCLTNFPGDPDQITPSLHLRLQLDEAVASQLPIVVSEIRKAGDDGNKWFAAMGRGEGVSARLRAMTIDIGGGTTDISIVQYADKFIGRGVELDAKVLFKDCNSVAGDQLRKMIIERVLLPRVIGNRANIDSDLLKTFLSGVQTTIADYAKWSRFTRVLFLPIINRWLSDLKQTEPVDFTMTDLFETNEDGSILESFNDEARRRVGVDLLPPDQSLGLAQHREAVRQCIRDCFGRPFLSLAKFVAAFECDLVIVSGKPSELPEIRSLLEEALPIMPSRLLFALGYRCGADNWPLSADGRVQDAKFVTVVGAALHQAIRSNLISNWSIEVQEDRKAFSENYWGVPDGIRLNPTLLCPGERHGSHRVMTNSLIGRKLLPGDSNPELIYKLRWKNRELWNSSNCTVDVRLERVRDDNGAESLRLTRATGSRNPLPTEPQDEKIPFDENDLELKLCTLQEDGKYWLDTGRFEVDWGRREQEVS